VLQMNVEPPAMVGMPLPGAESSGDELFRMGLLYSTGQGGAPLDYVSAHMLFNLAAMRNSSSPDDSAPGRGMPTMAGGSTFICSTGASPSFADLRPARPEAPLPHRHKTTPRIKI
jgi:hypothetical protein